MTTRLLRGTWRCLSDGESLEIPLGVAKMVAILKRARPALRLRVFRQILAVPVRSLRARLSPICIKYLKGIDDGPPTKRALRIYGSLTRYRAYLLIRLLTGDLWLATFAKLFGFRDDGRCVYGAVETVVYVVVDRSRLREARKQSRDKTRDPFGNISIAALLGGRNGLG